MSNSHRNSIPRGFAEAQSNYDTGKRSPITGKRSDMSVSAVRKGIWPAPVYEATFTDFSVHRISFWSRTGKPLDFDTGRKLCSSLVHLPVIAGCVYLGNNIFTDPYFEAPIVKIKPKRITTATLKRLLSRVLEGDKAAMTEARAALDRAKGNEQCTG